MIVPTPEEARALLAAIDPRDPFAGRDRGLLVLAGHTGLRVSEPVGLDVADVALRGTPRDAIHVVGKGSHGRTIPLNAAARQAVRDILGFNARRGFSTAPGAPLLVGRGHGRVSVRLVQRLVVTLRERAGLDVPVTPHSLRHRFATTICQTTGNLRVVQKLLGHRRLTTVEVYTHPTRADLENAVATLVPDPTGGATCA